MKFPVFFFCVVASAVAWQEQTGFVAPNEARRRLVLQQMGFLTTVAPLVSTPAEAEALKAKTKKLADTTLLCPKVLPRSLRIRVSSLSTCGAFLEKALGMTRLSDTTFSYGPPGLERPWDFLPGISTFDSDGAHMSFVLEETEKAEDILDAGDGVAYVQLAVPSLRASKILGYGGTLLSSYGLVEVLAPGCGFPFKLLLGDEVRDRAMYVCLRVRDVKKAAEFYESTGLFLRKPYPRARPPTEEESAFDPLPPKGSIYLGPPCDNDEGFGILLTRSKQNRFTGYYNEPNLGNVYQGIDLLLQDSSLTTNFPNNGLIQDLDGYPLRLLVAPSSKNNPPPPPSSSSSKR